MIKQDFISKYIQELNKVLVRIISLEVGNSDDGFLIIFNQMLQSYYKLGDNNLVKLLENDEERDQFLLADELKKKNMLTFIKAIKVYLNRNDLDKAKTCYNILERIEGQKSDVFQFPTEEDLLISKEKEFINQKMNNL